MSSARPVMAEPPSVPVQTLRADGRTEDYREWPASVGHGRGGAETALARRIVAHLERNYMEPLTLRHLEDETGFSAYAIIRAFRRDVGTTPHAFLMRLRVRRAVSLLEEGETIVAAAAEAGFADQSHFTRHFKRLFGMTPGRYVKAARYRRCN